jgi:hypothetical protein
MDLDIPKIRTVEHAPSRLERNPCPRLQYSWATALSDANTFGENEEIFTAVSVAFDLTTSSPTNRVPDRFPNLRFMITSPSSRDVFAGLSFTEYGRHDDGPLGGQHSACVS